MSLWAIALVGSVALVPTQTLAGRSDDGGSATHQNRHHESGDDLRNGRHHNEGHGHSSEDDRDRSRAMTTAPSEPTPRAGRVARSAGGASPETIVSEAAVSTIAEAHPAAPAVAAARGLATSRGVSLPGPPVPISHPPVTHPGGSLPPASLPSPPAAAPPPVLGPVPVLKPSLGVANAQAGAGPPWSWLIAFAIVDVLLGAVIIVRRRRARSGPR